MGIQTTTLISDGVLLDQSNDGRYVSYTKVSGSTETLFVLDRTTGVSVVVDSEPFNDHSSTSARGIQNGSLSSDGRYVFYAKGNLTGVGTPQGGLAQLFVKDLQSSAPATEVGVGLDAQDISANGQRVLFVSSFGLFDQRYFIKDISSGTVTQIASGPVPLDNAQLSPDGRFAVIETPPFFRVYDIQNGTVTQITGNPSPSGGGFSDNGRYVGYSVLDNSPASGHVYIRDLISGSTIVASASATGAAGDGDSYFGALSGDGRHVAFYSDATNLVPGDANGLRDLFIKDLDTGAIRRIASNVGITDVLLSYDGSSVLYGSGNIVSTRFLPPAIAVTTISGDGLVNAMEEGLPIPVSGTSDAIGQTVVVTSPSGATGSGVVQANGTWTVNVTSSGVADGARNFTAAVVDEFGVRGEASRTATFDSIAPSLTIGDIYVNAAEKALGSVVIGGTSDAIGSTVSLLLNNAPIGTAVVQPAGAWSLTYTVGGLADGDYKLDFRVADLAGNRNDRNIFLTVDTTAPELVIRSIGGDNVISSAEATSPVAVAGTSDAFGRTVTISVGGQVRGTATVQNNGVWTANIDVKGASGTVAVTATVADLAGNQKTATGAAFADSDIIRVSVAANGAQGISAPDFDAGYSGPTISPDGRTILFMGPTLTPPYTGTGIAPGATYLKDLATGALTPVSGGQLLSDNGNFVLQNGVGAPGLYVLNLATGVSTRADTSASDVPANDSSFPGSGYVPQISADGRWVVFQSGATNLVSGATTYNPQFPGRVYAKDMQTGEIKLVSFAAQETGMGFVPHSSVGGGRFVAFVSTQPADTSDVNRTNPSGGGAVGGADIFIRDLQTNSVTLISKTPGGVAGNFASYFPQISSDGRYVAFFSFATNLISGQTISGPQAYLHDTQTGTTRLISAKSDGTPIGTSVGGYLDFALSADSRYVAFYSDTAGVAADTNGVRDIYVKDMQTGALVLASSGGTLGGPSDYKETFGFDLTPDGRYITFASTAPDLVAGDTNRLKDIFIRRLVPSDTLTLSPIAGNDEITAAEASANGRAMIFQGTTSAALGSIVSIKIDGVEVATAVVGLGGTWSTMIDILGLSRTTHNVVASARDGAGFTASDGAIIAILPGARTLIGTPGDDTIQAVEGDSVDGRGGSDTIDFRGSLTGVVANTGNFTSIENLAGTDADDLLSGGGDNGSNRLFGRDGADQLFGNPGDDTLDGGAGADLLDGGDGNDSLNGGFGADSMRGGTGNDIYIVDSAGDQVFEVNGQGTDIVRTSLNTINLASYGDFVEQVVFTGIGNFNATGNRASNKFTGAAGDDKFSTDGIGSDVFGGGNGSDSVLYTKAVQGAVLNLATGTRGGAATGDVYGSIEKIFGSNTAADTMVAGTGRAVFSGQGGNDVLTGGANIDSLIGGAGNDTLSGGAAVDQLQGGLGNDGMNGGAGNDQFIFVEAAFGKDTITGWEDGLDRLKVNSGVADSLSDFTITGNGSSHVVLTLASDITNTITIDGLAGANITISASDFLFY